MLVMADENYPGPGDSFGRLDQYLFPFWEKSIQDGMDPEFGKEILKCFWIHCNTAYDGMIRTGGNQGITAGYGQLFTISGMGAGEQDMSNELTYILLDVIDEMSPILEPKPNVRLHRGTPDTLLNRVVDMIASSQGSPFLLNFDERSMAGMLLQARKSGMQHLINEDNVFDYAPVGCLENTMVGNDRSGTVDANLNLLKAVELALTGGYDLVPFKNAMTGEIDQRERWGADTGNADAVRILGAVLGGLCSPNQAHHSTHRRSLRAYGRPAGRICANTLCFLPGQRVCRKGTGHHPGGCRTGLRHHRGRNFCHHGRFTPGDQIPGF